MIVFKICLTYLIAHFCIYFVLVDNDELKLQTRTHPVCVNLAVVCGRDKLLELGQSCRKSVGNCLQVS